MSGNSNVIPVFSSAALVLCGLSWLTTPTLAATPIVSRSAAHSTLKISQSFKPPSRGTAPPSAGGATRGSTCLQGGKKLTSLVPQNRLGLTYSSNPTFYWYVPQSPAKTARFLLLNQDDTDVVYEATMTLPNQAGVMSFTLPQSTALQVGKQYHWYLVVGCSQLDQSVNPSVEGWVERVAPDAAVSQQLQKAIGRERATIYAENGIWHEAVTTLAKLRSINGQDAGAIAGWNELLKSVNLDAIAAEPLLNLTLGQN